MKFTHIKPAEWAYDGVTNTIYYDEFIVWKPCEGSEIVRSELCEKMLNGTPEEVKEATDTIEELKSRAKDDDIFEGMYDVFQGDDGKNYFVGFVNVGGEPCGLYKNEEGIIIPTGWRGGVMEPLCWQEVCRKDGAAK